MEANVIQNEAETNATRPRRSRQKILDAELHCACGKNCVRNTLLTLEELAAHTRLPLKWLRQLAAGGKLPCIKACTRLWFAIEEVESWIKKARWNQFGEYPRLAG